MLQGTVAFLLLVALALVGSGLRGVLLRRGLLIPGLEGLGFLLLGVLVGGLGLGLLPDDVLASLRPVVLLGLAWIGLVFGVQVELRVIRGLAPWHRIAGLAVPFGVGLTLLAAGLAVGLAPALALGVAAVGTIASPSTMEGLARGRTPADRTALRLLKLVMAFSGIPAVLALAVSGVAASPLSVAGGGWIPTWQLLVILVAVGAAIGYALLFLVRGVRDTIRLLTLLIGATAVTAGVSAELGLVGLPMAAVAGAVVVNRCLFPHRLLRAAHSLERPVLFALLVLVGASLDGVAFSWPTLAVMVGARTAALLAGTWLLGRAARRRGQRVTVAALGIGLLPQGELALGVLAALESGPLAAPGVLEAAVVAMVLNHVVGDWWIRRRLFRDVGAGAEPETAP